MPGQHPRTLSSPSESHLSSHKRRPPLGNQRRKKQLCGRQGKEIHAGLSKIRPESSPPRKAKHYPSLRAWITRMCWEWDLRCRPELFQPPTLHPDLKRNLCLWELLTRAGKLRFSLKCGRGRSTCSHVRGRALQPV